MVAQIKGWEEYSRTLLWGVVTCAAGSSLKDLACGRSS